MPFLSPNQQCQSTEGKISHSMDLLTPSSPGGLPTLSLTTNSSWLPNYLGEGYQSRWNWNALGISSMTVANSKGLRPKPWCIPTPTRKTSLLRGLRGIVLEWFQLCLSGIERSMSCSAAVHCPSSTSSAQCCKAQYWVSTVHRVHSIPCSCCGEAWYISTHVRWRHTAVSTLSSRWHSVSCCSAGTIHHIRRTLDVRQLPYNTDKTELLWVGSRHSLSQQDCCPPVSQLGPDSIVARDYVRLLGVTLSSDLSFDWHVSIISTSSFYWLRQLQRSLDMESAATLVHSFVASRVDYCNTLRIRGFGDNALYKSTFYLLTLLTGGCAESDDQQTARVLNERHSSCGQRYAQVRLRLIVTPPYRPTLAECDVSKRVVYKLGIVAFNCLHGQAPPYLMELYQPVAGVASQQHLWSATRQLVIPRYQLSTYGSLWLVRRFWIPCRSLFTWIDWIIGIRV